MLRLTDCWDSKTHKQITEYSSGMLWRFIQPNAKESETEEAFLNLTGLTKKNLVLLADIRFLMSPQVNRLINEVAPKIINRLSKESINQYFIDRGRVRGRIDWQRTISARSAAGNDTTLYVYSKKAQIFNLPENRVFLYMIKQINEKARNFATSDYLNLTWYAEAEEGSKWIEKVSILAAKSARLLRNPFISKIGNLYELTDKIIETTKSCRATHYRELAMIADRYCFCKNSPVSYLKQELNGNILEPLNKDTLFEIAVLFRTLIVAFDCGWRELKTGLVGGSTKSVSTLIKENTKLKVYYQKLPTEMAQNSKYGDIMAEYGLSEKLRRPDIILEFIGENNKDFIIIEVKRSKRRSYLVDGTYKLLGYLKDFERINCLDSKIRGFLVGWDSIALRDYKNDSEVHLYNWNNYSLGLQGLLNKT